MSYKLKVLLVEDDEYIRASLKVVLTDLGHTIAEAPNGKVAKNVFIMDKFDLVISDIQMPYFNGIEFLQWLRQEKHTTPVIMITGFSDLLETKSAIEYGAQDFLAKPFSRDELASSVERLFGPKKNDKAPESSNEDKFCRVDIEEFVGAKSVDYPIFIKVAERFVKIAHAGGKLDITQVSRFKEKGIRYLWIRKEDFRKVLSFNLSLGKVIAKASGIANEKKSNFLKYTAETVLENIFVDGTNPEDFNYAKDFMQLNLEMVSEDDDVFNLLEALQNHTDFLYAHSVGVSVYSVMLARKIGWTASSTLAKVGLAGLLHDIGKKEIPKEIINKPRTLLSAEEIKLLESHTTRGRDILRDMKNVPVEIAEVAFQHHELSHGGGFPRAIQDAQIHPIAKIIIIANRFCELSIRGPHREQTSSKEAIGILAGSSYDFNKAYWEVFRKMFK